MSRTPEGIAGRNLVTAGFARSSRRPCSAVTHDGRTVIGDDQVTDFVNQTAFHRGWIWTVDGGYTDIPGIPGYTDYSIPTAITADGQTVFGYAYSNSAGNSRAFIWDRARGSRPLRDALIAEFNLDLNDWPSLQSVAAVSADGRVLTGIGAYYFQAAPDIYEDGPVFSGFSETPFMIYLPDHAPACPADFNNDGAVNADDIFAYLNLWFAQLGGPGSTDLDNSGVVTADDLFVFLALWFQGC